MKTKLLLFIASLFAVLLILYSCEKDEFTEEDAAIEQEENEEAEPTDSLQAIIDSLERIGGIIQYTVNVVPGDEAGFNKGELSLSGIDSAVVTTSQYDIVKTTKTVNGIALFDDLRVGSVSVSVEMEGYTDVDFTAVILPETDTTVLEYYGVLRNVATIVPIFATTGNSLTTISGVVTYESSLINDEPEDASGVEIMGVIDVDDPLFTSKYLMTAGGIPAVSDPNLGLIHQIVYHSIVSQDVTSGTGAYSVTVPSTGDGLPIDIVVSDFAVNQQLLMNTLYNQPVEGIQSVRTVFSSNLDGLVDAPSTIPTTPPAYVEFSAPTGTTNAQPTTVATAVAHIGESGIESITITDQGAGYTQAPEVVITETAVTAPALGYGAEAVAVISNGKVVEVEITNSGQNYAAGNTITVSFEDFVTETAVATPVIKYRITEYTMTDNGSGYEFQPNVLVSSANGSGASAEAVMDGYVNEIDLVTPGSGYAQAPDIVLDGASGTGATATANMTMFNPVGSIAVAEYEIDTFTVVPEIVITGVGGQGSGATATCNLENSGKIQNITLLNAGLGYEVAPGVAIIGDGYGAVAHATLNTGDGSINIILDEGGTGYTSATVQISSPPAGGTQATAIARIGYKIADIAVTNGGNGYTDGNVGMTIAGIAPTLFPAAPGPDGRITINLDMSVESITVTNGGSDYTDAPSVLFIPVDGLGNGASAVSNILYEVESLMVLNTGSGYTFGDNVVVTIDAPTTETGELATATATKGGGYLAELVLENGGQGYLAPPNVTLTDNTNPADLVEAEITATVANGSITGFNIVDAGSNYSVNGGANHVLTIQTFLAAATADGFANMTSGQVTFVEITNPGAGYTVAPNVEFEVPNGGGGGSGATAVAEIGENGTVTNITVTNPGSGYFVAPVVKLVVPSYNLTASGRVIVNNSGVVTGVTLFDPNGNVGPSGEGYINPPTVTFTPAIEGMGNGATGIAVIDEGKVTNIIMTNGGSGYFAKNTPGAFGSLGNTAATAGIGFTFMNGGAGAANVVAQGGNNVIRDIYMGTGKRSEEY